ncbi:hypothetical protein Hanom_Chr05g00425111 [Helianthus anomalus]
MPSFTQRVFHVPYTRHWGLKSQWVVQIGQTHNTPNANSWAHLMPLWHTQCQLLDTPNAYSFLYKRHQTQQERPL